MTRDRIRTRGVVLLLAALAPAALAQERQGPPAPGTDPTPGLRERGAATLERLATKGGAAWTTFHQIGRDFLVVTIEQGRPGHRRVTVEVERQRERSPFLVLLERDGRMHVAEGTGQGGVYREREYPPTFAPFYRLMIASWPCALGPDAPGGLLGIAQGVAVYRRPALKEELERNSAEQDAIRQALLTNPDAEGGRDRLQRLVNEAHELRDGVDTRVDMLTGLVTTWGLPGRRSAIAGFEWRDDLGDDAFAVQGDPPLDVTDDPTKGDLDQLLLVGCHSPWAPDAPPSPFPTQLDARLVQLDRKHVRRVPFDGPAAMPGCFSRDRKRVYVMAHDLPGLWEVDLSTGANRPVAPTTLPGPVAYPAAAPDGKRLAVVHRAGGGPPRVMVVDLTTDTARPIGEPLEAGCLSWLPAAPGRPEALLLVTLTGEGETVAALSLDGELRPLRRGSAPLALPNGRVLLLDLDTHRWITCDAAGKAVLPLGDGLADCGSPTLAPDGARLVMVRAAARQAPALVTVDLATGKAEPLELGLPGLVGSPAWR